MVKAKLIWIAQHPDEPSNCEVSLDEPNDSRTWLHSNFISGEDVWVEWQPYVIIPLEE